MSAKVKLMFWPDTKLGRGLLIGYMALMCLYHGNKTLQVVSANGYSSAADIIGLFIDIASTYIPIVVVRAVLVLTKLIKPRA